MEQQKPVVSIGIIFKNEIRCLERCLKSLQPLRDAIPCQLVMADTGSDDGSREVAEKYADILIDFPWINDFAAARNSVMDRCTGKWYFSIDCDEWLDSNIDGIVRFATMNEQHDYGTVVIRNYGSADLDKGNSYSDFLGMRMLRMSTGLRYQGKVHEFWPGTDGGGVTEAMLVADAMLHHDGYLYQNAEQMLEKQKRNMDLLLKKLESDPDNLLTLMQCIESGDGTEDYLDYLYRAVAGVREKRDLWQLVGPPTMRYAVKVAITKKLPEMQSWLAMAEEMFPDSVFTRIDVAYYAFGHAWDVDDYAECVRRGEAYLQAVADYRAGRYNPSDILASSLMMAAPHNELSVSIVLASAYLNEKQPEHCLQLLERVDGRQMDIKQVGDCVRNYNRLYTRFDLDVSHALLNFWEQIGEPVPTKERAEQRRSAFVQMGAGVFTKLYRETEAGEGYFHRHGYTVFLPLEGKCPLGDAAVMLETEEPARLEELLSRQEDLERLPAPALSHALSCGVRFPLPGHPLTMEKMDAIAARLAQEKDELFAFARQIGGEGAAVSGDPQRLTWARGLCMAALRICDWKDAEEEAGLALTRTFVKVEKAFLPRCYAPEVLNNGQIFMLPPMHRFGWYCVQAFDTLETGDAAGFVRLLREGLDACEQMKDMVEFLLDHTPELKSPSDELCALAEQIRAILAAYPPDDPAVAALKASEAYQKVAYLIEGVQPPIVGGQMQ